MNVEDIASQSSVVFETRYTAWLCAKTISGIHVHVSPGSAETLVRRGGITNHRLIAYSLSQLCSHRWHGQDKTRQCCLVPVSTQRCKWAMRVIWADESLAVIDLCSMSFCLYCCETMVCVCCRIWGTSFRVLSCQLWPQPDCIVFDMLGSHCLVQLHWLLMRKWIKFSVVCLVQLHWL